jgi:hypothetical protein
MLVGATAHGKGDGCHHGADADSGEAHNSKVAPDEARGLRSRANLVEVSAFRQ